MDLHSLKAGRGCDNPRPNPPLLPLLAPQKDVVRRLHDLAGVGAHPILVAMSPCGENCHREGDVLLLGESGGGSGGGLLGFLIVRHLFPFASPVSNRAVNEHWPTAPVREKQLNYFSLARHFCQTLFCKELRSHKKSPWVISSQGDVILLLTNQL